jgi:hypothetical protein
MLKFYRCTLILFIGFLPFVLTGQASSHSDFRLKIHFAKNIPVLNLKLSYRTKNGNYFDSISFVTDITDNSITLFGNNNYVLWVSFPTLIFSFQPDDHFPGVKNFGNYRYFILISEGPLSSYTGKQRKKIEFSPKNSVAICSLKFHNHANAHKDLKIKKIKSYETYNEDLLKDAVYKEIKRQ